jgi:hypothetical protein
VLTGGDTGQSGPATAGLVSTALRGVENGLVRLVEAKNKHPVGYLKEQPLVVGLQCQARLGRSYRSAGNSRGSGGGRKGCGLVVG